MATEEDALMQNLADAGVEENTVLRFKALLEGGMYREQMQLLQAQRTVLLHNLHKSQQRLDCLDYLIYTMTKRHAANES